MNIMNYNLQYLFWTVIVYKKNADTYKSSIISNVYRVNIQTCKQF